MRLRPTFCEICLDLDVMIRLSKARIRQLALQRQDASDAFVDPE